MTTYHPPITGVELHMEEEILRQSQENRESRAQARRAHNRRQAKPSDESKRTREIEETMILGQ